MIQSAQLFGHYRTAYRDSPSFFNKATDPKHAGRTVVPGYGHSIDEADSAMGTQLHTDYRSGPAFLYDHEQAICNEAWRKQ